MPEADALTSLHEAQGVLVVKGGSYDSRHRGKNDVIGAEDDPGSIAALVRALDSSDANEAALMTPGTVSFAFVRDREVLAVVTFLSPNFVRCSELWSFDHRLKSPEMLAHWLADHGASIPDLQGL